MRNKFMNEELKSLEKAEDGEPADANGASDGKEKQSKKRSR